MSYFSDHYDDVRFPIADENHAGLWRGQRGALHAIGMHFTLKHDAALVVMPTGTGKTAVLILSAYLLRANRVLVLTSSKLVREQIAKAFDSLAIPKGSGALPADCPTPRVHEAAGLMDDPAKWEALREFDVVVGVPNSVSAASPGVVAPPADMFDVVLVDEAHHSAAKTWNAAIDAFPGARCVLFTATPFRRDTKEIKARITWYYPAADAFTDGIFGEVTYLAVMPRAGSDPDIAIAQAAERTFREDRAAGLDHRLMVRTDSKKRASVLEDVYGANTGLRLQKITSDHTLGHVTRTLNKLRAGDLDGVVCVDMMGEGFDFPQLKIAAVHAPHRSLARTLQFIGRFARTNADNLGSAKFLAVPNDIEFEAEKIYNNNAVWKRIVPNLLASKIDQEKQILDALDSFEPIDDEQDTFDPAEFSLSALRPFHHVKIYRAPGGAYLGNNIELSKPEVVVREISYDLNALILLMRSAERPDWTHLDEFATVSFDISLVYFHEGAQLLFICSSIREDWFYEKIASSLVDGDYRQLSPDSVYGALNGLTELNLFNLGMRKRTLAGDAETYRMLAGGAANRAISRADGNLYHRGHSYGTAFDGDRKLTIGLSVSSRLWSNRHSRLPEVIAWCDEQARRIGAGGGVVTGTELDFLQTGIEVDHVPADPIAVCWGRRTFTKPRMLYFTDAGGDRREVQLLDCELRIDRARTNGSTVGICLEGDDIRIDLDFVVDRTRHIELAAGSDDTVTVGGPSSAQPLVQYLNSELPMLFLADGSSLDGRILTPPPGEGFLAFDVSKVVTHDWQAALVDVQTEKRRQRTDGLMSVHEFVEAELVNSAADIVFFDDGSGEAADYIAVYESDHNVTIELYHCKGSGGASAGNRVDDAYDVIGQAMKSSIVVNSGVSPLVSHVKRRLKRELPSTFIKGDLERFEEIMDLARHRRRTIRMIAVQPGVTRGAMNEQIASLLGMGDDSLKRAGCEFMVWGSS